MKRDSALTVIIYNILKKIYAEEGLRVGFKSMSSGPDFAYAKAKELGIRKPFLSDLNDWVRYEVVSNEKLYGALAEHVQLEFIINSEPCNWRGTGEWLNFRAINEAFINDREQAIKNYSRLLIGISFGFRYKDFVGILEGLTENGFTQPK